MNIRTLLRGSIKPTIIIIVVSIMLSILLTMIIFYMDRVAMADSQATQSVVRYFNGKSLFLGFTYRIVDDFSIITRFIAEIGIVFLIMQLTSRIFRRH